MQLNEAYQRKTNKDHTRIHTQFEVSYSHSFFLFHPHTVFLSVVLTHLPLFHTHTPIKVVESSLEKKEGDSGGGRERERLKGSASERKKILRGGDGEKEREIKAGQTERSLTRIASPWRRG